MLEIYYQLLESVIGVILFLIIVYFAIIAMFYKKIPQGQALGKNWF